jgi:hypothetical protein
VIRAVLDTNVLVPPGLRRDLQDAAQEGAFTAMWSPWIIAELNRVLTWKWLERTATSSAARNVICDLSPANWQRCSMAATAMMEILLATFELVNPRPPYPETWDTLADVQDVPIWVAAVEGRKAGPSTSFRTTGATTRRSKRMAGTSIRASNTSVAQTSSPAHQHLAGAVLGSPQAGYGQRGTALAVGGLGVAPSRPIEQGW